MTVRGPLTALLLAAALAAAGCATQAPSPRQYLLDYPTLPAGALASPDAAPALLIDRVEVAGFLATSGIVFQTSDNEVAAAVQHRWGEPLERQLRRSLFAVLAGRLERVAVFESPPVPAAEPVRLSITLDAFQGRYDGKAVVAGTWQLTSAGGDTVARQRFRIERDLPADGYGPLVQTLSGGWREVAGQIAGAIRTATGGSG